MSFGNDELVDLLDGFGMHATDVIADASPVETLLAPLADLQQGSQVAIIAAEVLQAIVRQVGSQPGSCQDEDLPQRESFATLLGIGALQHIVGNQLQCLLTNL